MKNLIALFAILLSLNVLAQTPEKIKYQSVVRDVSGNALVNHNVAFLITIIEGTLPGLGVYAETHNITTNAFGIANLEIGTGNIFTGTFSSIDWGSNQYSIKVEIDPTNGTNWIDMGTTQLVSVPYALNSKKAETYNETDPIFSIHPANAITSSNITNWTTAFGWGNHATAGYLTSFTETDPDFSASPAHGITATNISNWNTAYGWGNHASAGYLTSEVDGSVTNEIQVLSIGHDTIYLSKSGGFVKVPSSGWALTGNAGTVDGTNFIGTTDNVPLNFKVNNQKAGRIDPNSYNTLFGYQAGNAITNGLRNTAMGLQALFTNTTGNDNTALGYQSLYSNTNGRNNTAIGRSALYSNNTGIYNTAIGNQTLISNTTGNQNTALGYQTLYNNTVANQNTACGSSTMFSNIIGENNTAYGLMSLYSNVAGNNATAIGDHAMYYTNNSATTFVNYNVAVGFESLRGSTTASDNTGNSNTAVGYQTLSVNSSGSYNTAVGTQTLQNNTTGNSNTASGWRALLSNTSGYQNNAYGFSSLGVNTTGYQNIAFGVSALGANTSGFQNIAIGAMALNANTTGSQNTVIGNSADVSSGILTNASCFGYSATVNASNKIRLGNSSVTVIEGQVAYTFPSDGRFKSEIKENVKGLEFITKLRPVTYVFNTKKFDEFLMKDMPEDIRNLRMKEIDYEKSSNIIHTGFIAQEVEQAVLETGITFDGIHIPDNANDNYSIGYSQFVVPLVKAVQELNSINEKQQKEIEDLKQQINELIKK